MSKTEIIREVNGLRFYKKGDTYFLSKITDGTLQRVTFLDEGAQTFIAEFMPVTDGLFLRAEIILAYHKASGHPNYYEVKIQ